MNKDQKGEKIMTNVIGKIWESLVVLSEEMYETYYRD